MSRCVSLLLDRAQNISRTGDVRQIDLGLEIVLAATGACGLCTAGGLVGVRLEIFADQHCLMLFDRAGVRFLFGNTDGSQSVKNRLALDFQLARQIVDSNLAHPPSRLLIFR